MGHFVGGVTNAMTFGLTNGVAEWAGYDASRMTESESLAWGAGEVVGTVASVALGYGAAGTSTRAARAGSAAMASRGAFAARTYMRYVIRTTAEHPFYVDGRGWVTCNELRLGDRLLTEDGTTQVVNDLLDSGEWETVYNLRIADFHTYFVGGEDWGFGVWAHNKCGPEDVLGAPNRFANKAAAWKVYKSANPTADLAVWSRQYDALQTQVSTAASRLSSTAARRTGGYRLLDHDAYGRTSPGINRSPGHKNVRPDGYVQSHHAIQKEWANRNIPGYKENVAPGLLLKSASGESHAVITGAQASRRALPGGWDTPIRTEFNEAYREMITAGVPMASARHAMVRNYKYFDALGAFR